MARHSPGTRIALGKSVLAAAHVVDTRLVDARLARFERAHRDYERAQATVDAAELEMRAARAQVAASVHSQKQAVESLARALVGDGHPLGNPFEAFRAPTRGRLTRLPPAAAAQAVHTLVRAIRRSKRVGEATLRAAEGADAAAKEIEQHLAKRMASQRSGDAARTSSFATPMVAPRRCRFTAGEMSRPPSFEGSRATCGSPSTSCSRFANDADFLAVTRFNGADRSRPGHRRRPVEQPDRALPAPPLSADSS